MSRIVAVTTGQFELHDYKYFLCQHQPRVVENTSLFQQRLGLGQIKILLSNPPEALTQELLDKAGGDVDKALEALQPAKSKAQPKAKE